MNKNRLYFLFLIFITALSSCKKCYKCYDEYGQPLVEVCGKNQVKQWESKGNKCIEQ